MDLSALKPLFEVMASVVLGKFGAAVQIFAVIYIILNVVNGLLNLIPAVIKIYTDATPSAEDDGLADKVMNNKVVKTISEVIKFLLPIFKKK